MGVGASEPSQARRLVGELIRIHRTRAGLTQKEASERLLVSESLLGAYERAERIPGSDFLRTADEALDARGALLACLASMEEEKYPPKFVDWVRLERAALVISAYETMVIPGLLQTESYVRALYEVRVPAFTEAEVAQHVEARLERQAVLTRNPPPRIGFVIEEAALDRPIGGSEVLREQLRQLLEYKRTMSHLTLQVMPTHRHAHAGLMGPMKLMGTGEGRNLVYVEGQGGDTVISKPERVNELLDLFGILRAQALTPWESLELIEQKVGKL